MTKTEYLESKWQEVLNEVKKVDEQKELHGYYDKEMKKLQNGGRIITTHDGRKVILYKAGER